MGFYVLTANFKERAFHINEIDREYAPDFLFSVRMQEQIIAVSYNFEKIDTLRQKMCKLLEDREKEAGAKLGYGTLLATEGGDRDHAESIEIKSPESGFDSGSRLN